MAKKIHFTRCDQNFEPSDTGRVFIAPNSFENLTNFNVLYSSVDTVRQLYKMKLKTPLIDDMIEVLDGSSSPRVVYQFAGDQWLLRRGGASGYQFMLQNAEKGLVLLIKSRYATLETSGTHLKIEVSPKVIFDHTPVELQTITDMYADMFALDSNYAHAGCAVHLACDFQGWVPPNDFASRLTCRSRRIADRAGISELTLDTDICSVHGAGQSYLFGSASSMQFALYNKTKEALHSDKVDYMHDRWSEKMGDDMSSIYDPDVDVWRAELRFSHSVIEQFARANPITDKEGNSKSADLRSFVNLIDHLGGLWAYGLNNFRYDYNTKYVHPVWTVVMSGTGFDSYDTGFVYRREYKTPGVGNGKNVALALGNMLSIFARNKFSAQYALQCLKESGIYIDACEYFRSRGLDKSDMFKFIEDGLIQRRLGSKLTS